MLQLYQIWTILIGGKYSPVHDVTVPRPMSRDQKQKCILPEWLTPFSRIFCTITIQKPFRRNLSMRFCVCFLCLLQQSKKVKQQLESATGRRRKKRAKKFWLTGSEFAPG